MVRAFRAKKLLIGVVAVFAAAGCGSDAPELVDDVGESADTAAATAPTTPPLTEADPTTPPVGDTAPTVPPTDGASAPAPTPDQAAPPSGTPAPVTVSDNATVTVETETGTFAPEIIECVINTEFVTIIASGDGDLTISGTSELLLIEFLDPAQNLTEISDSGVDISPGRLEFTTSTGKNIIAENCDIA